MIDTRPDAGTLSARDTECLRDFVADLHAASALDEDVSPPIVSGAADGTALVMVVVAAVALVALSAGHPIILPLFAPLAWLGAEYATRVRRLSLTGGVLTLLYAIGVSSLFLMIAFKAAFGVVVPSRPSMQFDDIPVAAVLFVAIGSALACGAYWRRFRTRPALLAMTLAALNAVAQVLRAIL